MYLVLFIPKLNSIETLTKNTNLFLFKNEHITRE